MNNELIAVLNYMERERGISRSVVIQSLETALLAAARKRLGKVENLRVNIDPKTCDIKAFGSVEVVEKPARGDQSVISLEKARLIDPDAQIGSIIDMELHPGDLGRIAAQAAKQTIIQKIRQAERDVVFDEYKDRVGEIVTGKVLQFNKSDMIIDLGRAQAILPAKERVSSEEYMIGDAIRAYVLNVSQTPGPTSITLSRSHPEFVKALFKLEVSEIAEGIVEIMGIAREPGYRTKIAVKSNDDKVDPVGACVGMRGIRVKNIVRELTGEKIDIVRWDPDIKVYTINALAPAKLKKVEVDPEVPNLIHVTADADQLSLAIGKRGQNVRLTARLLRWKVDIKKDESDESFEKKVEKAVESLAAVDGISEEDARTLVNSGVLTVDGVLAYEIEDLAEATGWDLEHSEAVHNAADKFATDSE